MYRRAAATSYLWWELPEGSWEPAGTPNTEETHCPNSWTEYTWIRHEKDGLFGVRNIPEKKLFDWHCHCIVCGCLKEQHAFHTYQISFELRHEN